MGEIKVEPNLDKTDLRHGKAFDGSDVIVISSDSEPESKPRVKAEDIGLRLKPTATKAKGKARNRAIPVPKTDVTSNAAFDRGSFIQESETVWTDSDIMSFVIEGDLQVTAELWVKRVEYLSEIPYIFPIPKVATAFIVDLQDEKFLVPKSERDPEPRRPDALIKSKVRCLATKNITPNLRLMDYSCYHNDRPLQLFYTDGISKRISARQHPESFCDRQQTSMLSTAVFGSPQIHR
jgi:hypothetical protein